MAGSATDFSGDFLTTTAQSTPSGWIDPITGTLGKLTDIYVELQNQKTAGQAYTTQQQAALTAAQTAAQAQANLAAAQATAAGQWIPGVSNSMVVIGAIAVIGGLLLLGALRK